MKLAEALMMRSNIIKEIKSLQERATENAQSQDGDEPSENPLILVTECCAKLDFLNALIQRINRTNAAVKFSELWSLTDAIVARTNLEKKINVYNEVCGAASGPRLRYTRNEIKYVSNISVADFRKQIDSLSKELRELDSQIQAINWITELIEE